MKLNGLSYVVPVHGEEEEWEEESFNEETEETEETG